MKKASILIVDSNSHVVRHLKDSFECAGYKAVAVRDGLSALRVVEAINPDLVVIDIVLPCLGGFELLQRIRELSDVPLVVLSELSDEAGKVKCFNLGADDFVTKPYGIDEVLARVAAILRRRRRPEEAGRDKTLVCGDISIDFGRRQVKVRDREVNLTPTEFKLLGQLMANSGRVMFHEELLSRVWGVNYSDEVEYLRVYVRYLRTKIEVDPSKPKYILSKPGVGYAFAPG